MPAIKVLLVDDEVSFTASMQKVLSRRGFDVKVASDGLTALPMIAKEHFDVVVLDIKMPGMDGTQVFTQIKRFSPDIRVILLTGHYSLTEEEDILKKGAFAYLLKPYPVLDLVKVIVSAASDKETGSNSSAKVEDLAEYVKTH
jgi:DNA-binding NtrC family response regulator